MTHQKFKQGSDYLGKLHWYHWLVVLASGVLTLAAWYITSNQIEQKTEIQFNYQAEQIIELVKERMDRYEDALIAGIANIQTHNNQIDANSWKIFSQSLSIGEKYPGINGIGVIYYVPPENLAQFLAEQRILRPDFVIHPEHWLNEYWPITHIEPVESNRKAVGLDMAHENNRLTAAKKARDTGTSQITAPIILVQDAKKTPGFLFYAPYYRDIEIPETVALRQQKFSGNVYAAFIMQNLMSGTLLNENRLVNFNINDGKELLYDELNTGSTDYDQRPLFSRTIVLPMRGRDWLFTIQSTELFRQQYKNNQPTLILIGGIIIDCLLLGLFLTLGQSNKKAYMLASDMTKELSRSEQKLNLTIESMMDGLLTVDDNNTILSLNQSAEKLYATSAAQLIGRKFSSIVQLPPEIQPEHYLLNLLGKGIVEVKGLRNTDESFSMEIAVNQVEVEDQQIYTVIVRDISERKVAELLKSQFVSTVSHELRTPLTSIRGALGLVLNLAKNQLSEDLLNMLKLANRNSERLTLLINDLLDLEKMDSNQIKMNFEVLDIVELVKDCINDADAISHEKEIKLCLVTSLTSASVYGDANRLNQVLNNLISNAIKYSPKTHSVEISIQQFETNIRIGVTDCGAGVPDEFKSRIFQRFAQADSSDTREKGGTGLGLSISKAIIQQHYGSIDYQSTPNVSTCFYFELPLYVENKTKQSVDSASETSNEKD